MADWSAFATAFLNKTAEQMQEGLDKASEYEDQQREAFESNKALMQKRRMVADGVKSRAAKLRAQGIPEEMVRSAIASGPNGIIDLERSAGAAIGKYGPDAVRDNPDVILGTGSLSAEGALMTGDNAISIDQYIEQSYGITPGDMGSYEAGDVGFLGRLYGAGGKDRVRAKLDAEAGAMGYSIYDLNQAAKSQDYESITGGGFVNYASPNIFTAPQMQDEITGISTTLTRSLANNEQYKEATAGIAASEEAMEDKLPLISTDEGAAAEYAQAQQDLQGYRATKRRLEADVLGPLIRQQGQYYDLESYQNIMGPTIDTMLGVDGFTASVLGKPSGTVTPEAAGEVIAEYEGESILGGVPFTVKMNDNGEKVITTGASIKSAKGAVVPAGTTLSVAESEALLSKLEETSTTQEVSTLEAIPTEGLPIESIPEGSISFGGALIDKLDLGDPTAIANGKPAEKKNTELFTSLASEEKDFTQYMEEQGIDKNASDDVLIKNLEAWAEETGKELPADKTPILYGIKFGPTPEKKESESFTLLKANAVDMIDYLKGEGVAKDASDETLIKQLTKWAKANKKKLPKDKTEILYAIKFGLRRE